MTDSKTRAALAAELGISPDDIERADEAAPTAGSTTRTTEVGRTASGGGDEPPAAPAPPAVFSVAEAAAESGLEAARKALAQAHGQLDSIQSGLFDATARADAAHEARDAIVLAAARKEPTALREATKLTKEHDEATAEVALLALAIPQAQQQVRQAEEAEEQALRSLKAANAHSVFADELLPLAAEGDATIDHLANIFEKREAVYQRLLDSGVIDPATRIEAGLSLRLFEDAMYTAFRRFPALAPFTKGTRDRMPMIAGAPNRLSLVDVERLRAESVVSRALGNMPAKAPDLAAHASANIPRQGAPPELEAALTHTVRYPPRSR